MKWYFIWMILSCIACGKIELSHEKAAELIKQDLKLNEPIILQAGAPFIENNDAAIRLANRLLMRDLMTITHRTSKGYFILPSPELQPYVASPKNMNDSGAIKIMLNVGHIGISKILEVSIDHELDMAYIQLEFTGDKKNPIGQLLMENMDKVHRELVYQWNDDRWIRRTEGKSKPEIIKEKIVQMEELSNQ